MEKAKLVFMVLGCKNWIQASNSCLSNYWQPLGKEDEIHFYDPYYNYIIMNDKGEVKVLKDTDNITDRNKQIWQIVIPTEEAKLMMMKQNVYSLIPYECLKEK